MTTPEPVQPPDEDIQRETDDFMAMKWPADEYRREPLSPAPDTEALRELELWSVLDWSLWGNGLGGVLRSEMADVMVAALTPEQREQAEACIKAWHERRGPSMAVGVGTQLERERDEARAEVVGLHADLDRARAERDAARIEVSHRSSVVAHLQLQNEVLQRRSAGARTIPDDAAELVAKRMLRIKLYGVALSTRYDWQAHRQWTQQLTDDERADWLRDARALLADLGATPTTGPDDQTSSKIDQILVEPTTGPAPAAEQTNPSQDDSSGTVPQRFQTADRQTNAGPAPAAAEVQWGVQRADGVLDQMDDEEGAHEHLTWFDPGTAEVVSRNVTYGPWTSMPTSPQAPAQPTAKDEVRVEMADRLYAVWELATAATRDGHGLTGEQAARIEHLTDLRHPLDAGDLA